MSIEEQRVIDGPVLEAHHYPESILEMLKSPVIDEYVEKLAESLSRLDAVWEKCSNVLQVKAIPAAVWNPPRGVAIDSTYPPEGGMDLVAGVLTGYVVGALQYLPPSPRRIIRANVLLLDDPDGVHRELMIISKREERRLATEILESLPRGSLLLIDGEIVPYILYFSEPKDERVRELDELTYKLLSLAEERGTVIAGVVKRSYTYLFNVVLGGCIEDGKLLRLNDKTIASLILESRPGSYIVLGEYGELLPRYAEVIARLRGSRAKLAEVVSSRLSQRPLYGRIGVVFYKPSVVNAGVPAVKLEVFIPESSGVTLENLLSHLDSITNRGTGLPAPIDLVDSLVRVEAGMLEVVRLKLLRLLRDRVPGRRGALVTLQFTNLEKYYVYLR